MAEENSKDAYQLTLLTCFEKSVALIKKILVMLFATVVISYVLGSLTALFFTKLVVKSEFLFS
jgi:hypothetical protein